MKATELRINNAVLYKGKIWFIAGIHRAGAIDIKPDIDHKYSEICDISEIEPVPLTVEYLEKVGYEIGDGHGDRYYHPQINALQILPPDKYLHYRVHWDYGFLRELQFVHELQNIYFLLNGIELIDIKK